MKRSSIIVIALMLMLCSVLCACNGANGGKVNDTTQGVDIDLTTTQNITTVAGSTTYGANGITQALTDVSDLLTPTSNVNTQ